VSGREVSKVSFIRTALLILLVSGAFSCYYPTRQVDLSLEEGLEEVEKALKPLPKGWSYGKQGLSKTQQVGSVRVEILKMPPEGYFPQESTSRSWKRVFEKTLSILPYAPRTSFLDPTLSIEEAPPSSLVLYPLDTIQLPYKALRVRGLAPDDQGYPYLGRVLLRISVPLPSDSSSDTAGRETLRALIQWAESIPPLSEEKIFWIGAVGDIFPGRGVETLLLQGERGIAQVFGDTLSVLQKQDLLLGNLEGPLTTRGTPIIKTYTFRFPPPVLEALKKAGFRYLSLTNNHVVDYGKEGLLDTLQAFGTFGMGTSGIGSSLEEARTPWKFLSPGGRPIYILSMGAYPPEKSGFDGRREASAGIDRPGILWASEENLESLKKSYPTGGMNILMVHGGHEWQSTPHRGQVDLYRGFIDRGVDIVFGSHPHVVQGMEAYRGKLIFYSLGNFLFPGMDETLGGEESVIVSCGVYRGKVRYLEVYPVRLQGTTVRLDPSSKTIDRFYQLSQALRERNP